MSARANATHCRAALTRPKPSSTHVQPDGQRVAVMLPREHGHPTGHRMRGFGSTCARPKQECRVRHGLKNW
jgi:hypothetical protein